MARVLLTGGHGLLGSALAPALAARGHAVRSASRTGPPGSSPGGDWVPVDLATGQGLAEAVAGMEVVIHAATAGLGDSQSVDVAGTERLLAVCRPAGIEHFHYVSILGIDRVDAPYYRNKLAAEQLVQSAGLPYSILRAAQFHELVDAILNRLLRRPVGIVDLGLKFQAIAAREVAARIIAIVEAGERGRARDIAGPEVRTMRSLVPAWLRARRLRRLVLPGRFPGGLWQGWRQGLTTDPDRAYGTITWEQWLAGTYGSRQ